MVIRVGMGGWCGRRIVVRGVVVMIDWWVKLGWEWVEFTKIAKSLEREA